MDQNKKVADAQETKKDVKEEWDTVAKENGVDFFSFPESVLVDEKEADEEGFIDSVDLPNNLALEICMFEGKPGFSLLKKIVPEAAAAVAAPVQTKTNLEFDELKSLFSTRVLWMNPTTKKNEILSFVCMQVRLCNVMVAEYKDLHLIKGKYGTGYHVCMNTRTYKDNKTGETKRAQLQSVHSYLGKLLDEAASAYVAEHPEKIRQDTAQNSSTPAQKSPDHNVKVDRATEVKLAVKDIDAQMFSKSETILDEKVNLYVGGTIRAFDKYGLRFIEQNPNKKGSNGQPSEFAKKAKEGHRLINVYDTAKKGNENYYGWIEDGEFHPRT